MLDGGPARLQPRNMVVREAMPYATPSTGSRMPARNHENYFEVKSRGFFVPFFHVTESSGFWGFYDCSDNWMILSGNKMLFTKVPYKKKWQLTDRFFSTSYTAITTTRALIKTKGHPCRYMGKIIPGLSQIAISQAGNPPKHPSSGLTNKSTGTAFSSVSPLKFGVNGTEHSNNLLKGSTNSILWVGESQAALIWLLGNK